MENKLEKKYGLMTAIAMVVGIVIGSGVFFKAEAILIATGGNLPQGILAWIIGGLVMIICAYNFAILASKHEKVSGIVDYAEVMVGKKYGYFFAWFMATIYYPTLTSVLAWVSARYFCVLMGWDIVGGQAMVISCFFLITSFVINTLAPKIGGKLQVSTTFIKLIPLFLMAIVGTFTGLQNGLLVANFSGEIIGEVSNNPLLTAIVSTAFAYEGWICATSINAELKDAKRNLPKALIGGTLLVIVAYVLYYIGLAGAVENQTLMAMGQEGAKMAFSAVFTQTGGVLLFVFVVISCLGTLNGLTVACTRAFYAIGVRGEGPAPKMFAQVDPVTNMPSNSSIIGLFLCGVWLLYFYGANLDSWFAPLRFDSSELPIITIYSMYIPIFAMQMKKATDLSFVKRYLVPLGGIIASLFMVYAAIVSHQMAVVYYLIIFAVIIAYGFMVNKPKANS